MGDVAEGENPLFAEKLPFGLSLSFFAQFMTPVMALVETDHIVRMQFGISPDYEEQRGV